MSTPVGVSPYVWDEDLPRKAALEQHGDVQWGSDVVAWFPAGAVAPETRAAIVARLDRGVRAAKRFTNRPDWNFRGDRRVHFYFPDDRFISHAPGGNSVYVPLWRIVSDQAPWLHEAMHILLFSPQGDWLGASEAEADARMPLWLEEGLPDVLAIAISEQEGLAYYTPTSDRPPASLDSECARQLQGQLAERITPLIGARGRLPELFGPERRTYAPAFYNCSASFVGFIRDRFGYEPLLAAIAAFGQETEVIERATDASLPQLRLQWLEHIHALRPLAPAPSRDKETR